MSRLSALTIIAHGVSSNQDPVSISHKHYSTNPTAVYARTKLLTDDKASESNKRSAKKYTNRIKAEKFLKKHSVCCLRRGTLELSEKFIERVKFLLARGRCSVDIAFMEARPIETVNEAMRILCLRYYTKLK